MCFGTICFLAVFYDTSLSYCYQLHISSSIALMQLYSSHSLSINLLYWCPSAGPFMASINATFSFSLHCNSCKALHYYALWTFVRRPHRAFQAGRQAGTTHITLQESHRHRISFHFQIYYWQRACRLLHEFISRRCLQVCIRSTLCDSFLIVSKDMKNIEYKR